MTLVPDVTLTGDVGVRWQFDPIERAPIDSAWCQFR